ncbi:MAG: putative arylsulfatase regulatory protein [Amycolatopsis sp.]|uniref:cyclophane-forming radical SAM peptide maturase AmcB n=1 Tax=Amycolatopsis sp. TaxID=37632 RepID=UPI0026220100|nr:cyclophane-forming radical SAM peptide maturase AmcB [Amycolatopsis sp.]MCU1685215.1 putative arylsulfatase regulatory protein [Amycolatopsis sp.]
MDEMGLRTSAHPLLAAAPSAIILQPTSLCPLNCTYCYLPQRHLNQQMTTDTAAAIAAAIPPHWSARGPVEIVWHGGEPLAVGRSRLTALMEPFEPLRADGRIRHVVQTAATLIDRQWCELFQRYGFAVGVSIDGPEPANRHRVDRRGRPAFDRAMTGIETLRRHDIPFTILAVVSADSTNAGETLDFLASTGCTRIGINIEAAEAANQHGHTPALEQARQFWREAFTWSAEHPEVEIREIEWLLGFLGLDKPLRDADAGHDPLPTIGWNGEVVLLSPELLGVQEPRYADFVAGNVTTEPLPSILDRAAGQPYVREFLASVQRCKETCEFFAWRQGAHAGNRYFEHGTFTATETNHCQTSFQAPVLALHDLMI